eukprot:3231127-Rhodomonas_salina.2
MPQTDYNVFVQQRLAEWLWSSSSQHKNTLTPNFTNNLTLNWTVLTQQLTIPNTQWNLHDVSAEDDEKMLTLLKMGQVCIKYPMHVKDKKAFNTLWCFFVQKQTENDHTCDALSFMLTAFVSTMAHDMLCIPTRTSTQTIMKSIAPEHQCWLCLKEDSKFHCVCCGMQRCQTCSLSERCDICTANLFLHQETMLHSDIHKRINEEGLISLFKQTNNHVKDTTQTRDTTLDATPNELEQHDLPDNADQTTF